MVAEKNERRNQISISDTNLWKSRSCSIVISRFVKRMLFKISRQMLHIKFTYNLPTSVAVNKLQNRSTLTAQCEKITQNPPLSEERWKGGIFWRSYQSDLFPQPTPPPPHPATTPPLPPPPHPYHHHPTTTITTLHFSYPRQLCGHSLTYAIVIVPKVEAQLQYCASRVWVYIWSIYIYNEVQLKSKLQTLECVQLQLDSTATFVIAPKCNSPAFF